MAYPLTRIACPNCEREDLFRDYGANVLAKGSPSEHERFTCTKCEHNFSLSAGVKAWAQLMMLRVPHAGEDSEGKWAIIRPNSYRGHSPSRRFKTEYHAIEAACVLAEKQVNLTFEVVRITKRVSVEPLKVKVEDVS